MITPTRMKKVQISGPKSRLDQTIRVLYREGVLDIEEYEGQYDSFEIGVSENQAEAISNVLVKLRSVKDTLPDVEPDSTAELMGINDLQQEIEELHENVETIQDEIEDRRQERDRLETEIKTLKRFRRFDVDIDAIRDYDRLDTYFGTVERSLETDALPDGRYDYYKAGNHILLFVDTTADVQSLLTDAGFEERSLDLVTDLETDIETAISERNDRIEACKDEIADQKDRLETLAEENLPTLEANEEELEEELEKASAPLNFATGEKSFIAEGWVPADKYERLQDVLHDEIDAIHTEENEDPEKTPPVEYENPGPVENFESLTELVSVPRYNELDPTFMLFLTFPLFFGFMIGDAGYGLTSALVFYGGMRMYPSAKPMFKALMMCSFMTLLFGLIFGDAFGYVLFGHHSEVAAVTGLHFLEEIPIIFHRAETEYLPYVLYMAAGIGFAHVNLGLVLDTYREYINHGLVASLIETGGWFTLQIGAATAYLYDPMVGVGVIGLGVLHLGYGEGIEGVVEIPSLLSNMLSYLRLFGVAVAAIFLAKTVNALASPLYAQGTLIGMVGGTLILMIGHTFNTFIKIMEGFLQGIRLHYVELFSQFYEGGGRKYIPFGNDNNEYSR
ncbi:MAG: V-type ATP synthase subunit I [Candidatus Nanohaloarchaeota archaeon QJJ-5]|nr:V-type ATP synthase subunit I [Candidatus Nanohaloarchaeota archaeon QJJ-5]